MNDIKMPDAKVMFLLMSNQIDGEMKKVKNGAWFYYLLKPGQLVSAYHIFPDKEVVTGEKAEAHINFLVSDVVLKSLTIGQQIPVFEGTREIGVARVLEILNLALKG